MATTLAQLAENSQDKIAQGFINEIITDSYLLGAMVFDDCMSNNGQPDLTYGYKRVITGATASFRSLDEEGAVSDVEVKKYTTNVAILNSTFQMDRVAAKAAPDLLDLKLTEAKNAIIRKFNSTLIAGDTATDAKGFDGLSKALTGSSTEVKSAVDITTVAKIKENALAFADELDGLLSLLDGDPSVILCGRAMKVKLNTIAKALGISQLMADDAGKQIDNWGGIPIQKLTDGALTTNRDRCACLWIRNILKAGAFS